MDGVGAKDDDDTGKSRERDRDLRGDAESFARLHSDDEGRTRTEIKAQIHAPLNQQLFDRSPNTLDPLTPYPGKGLCHLRR